MSSPKRLLQVLLPVAAAVVAITAAATPATGQSPSCTDGYTYAGRLSATRAHGVRATLAALSRPQVATGHVAAWVGVGGVGEGPNGSDAWIQIGLSAFPGSESRLYYEVTRPGAPPTYHEIDATVRIGERLDVAVLEMGRRANHWRVWVNGEAVSEPVHLPASSGRWRPIATAESWAGNAGACNSFSFRFEGVRVSAAAGGNWRSFVEGHRFLDTGYRLVDRGSSTFVATTG
jgi:hypothetical protein